MLGRDLPTTEPEVLSPEADLRPRPSMQSYSCLCITKMTDAIGQKKALLICGPSLEIHINIQGWREELKLEQIFQYLHNMSQWVEPKLNPQAIQSLLRHNSLKFQHQGNLICLSTIYE